MSLSYLKGMRTRYTNLISKELEKIKPLLSYGFAAASEEQQATQRKTTSSLYKLKEYLDKLEEICEKLAIEVEKAELEEDAMKLHVEEQDKTSKLIEVTLEAIGELTDLANDLLLAQKSQTSNLEKILEVQTQLLEKWLMSTSRKRRKQQQTR